MASSNPWRPSQPANAPAPSPGTVPAQPLVPQTLRGAPPAAWTTVDVNAPSAGPTGAAGAAHHAPGEGAVTTVTSPVTMPAQNPAGLHERPQSPARAPAQSPNPHDVRPHDGPHPVMALPAFPEDGSGPPPPRSKGWGWLLLVVILAAVAALLIWLWPRVRGYIAGGGKPQRPERPIQVVGARASRGNLPVYLAEYGTVTPMSTVTLHSRVDGQITRINFREGDYVHQGDPVIELDPRPYEVQKQQALAQLDKDTAALNNAKADLSRYTKAYPAIPQQQVATQQATVDQDLATVEADKTAVNSAQLNLIYCNITAPISGVIGLRSVDIGNIVHSSDATGMATITPMDPITVIFALPQTDIPQVQEAIEKVMSGNAPDITAALPANVVEPMSTPLQSPMLLPVTRPTTLPAAETAALSRATPQAAGHSPASQSSTAAASTQPQYGLRVDAFGQGVDVTSAHPGDLLATGALAALDNQVDPTSGTVRLRAAFNNPNRKLFPNEFVNVRLLVDVREQAVLVPNAAVQYGPDASADAATNSSSKATFVYVIKQGEETKEGKGGKKPAASGGQYAGQHKGGGAPTTAGAGEDAGIPGEVEIRNVQAGVSQGGFTEIISGIEPGDVVITDGVDKLVNGSKVDVHFAKPATQPSTKPQATQPQPGTFSGKVSGHQAGAHQQRQPGSQPAYAPQLPSEQLEPNITRHTQGGNQ